MEVIFSGVGSIVAGFAAAYSIGWLLIRQTRNRSQEHAASIVGLAKREAEVVAKEATSALQLDIDEKRGAFERESKRIKMELEVRLNEIHSHEESLATLGQELRLREKNIELELDEVRASKSNLLKMSGNVQRTMANLASMDVEEIKSELREQVELECCDALARMRKDLLERSEVDVNREANRTLLAAMQRIASKPSSEISASIIQLPNDDMKGRIIGREGRNIKCFETATGTTLLIDESPRLVLISSFDPVRREIAKTALEGLVKDGRIHPATIEEFVGAARADVDGMIEKAGDAAINQLKISRMHPQIATLLGKLKFRTSYSQNVLEHSVEVGMLCSIIASELGLDPNLAKRAGLLHDIGKAIDGEYEGSHAIVGADFVKARGENDIVVNAVAAHHEEVPPESLYAGIVILADTISAVRPGARAESISAYIDRLQILETLARSFEGVKNAYAIQAGREVRVVVDPSSISDEDASNLSIRMRERIEDELDYPSSIRIIVIREQRYVETAK
ncbi:MAG: ribonuclease Y [Opitutales bacterium]|jgi:ribonuclease Y|nr:ribonuclease Y [Opitutales bacterium]MBT5167618.1 ribonuclease Y [Opitutales bacterium]MBT5813184.1 ribonuclease Y [Opitutales bacterium]MBT6380344.1 ribonuclease Y [Opitutales bacterium]MBT6769777.1 ribonuclease Y [Opitutales bacterium]